MTYAEVSRNTMKRFPAEFLTRLTAQARILLYDLHTGHPDVGVYLPLTC